LDGKFLIIRQNDFMLKSLKTKTLRASGGTFAIVAASFS
jgi:hypothetical protein